MVEKVDVTSDWKPLSVLCDEPQKVRTIREAFDNSYSNAEFYRDGQRICVWCGRYIKGRQRRYCCPEHRDEVSIRNNMGYVRRKLQEIDNGVCAVCGADELESGNWHADHIVGVQFGGGCCAIWNFRTLCKKCHKAKTAYERKVAANPFKYPDWQRTLFDAFPRAVDQRLLTKAIEQYLEQ